MHLIFIRSMKTCVCSPLASVSLHLIKWWYFSFSVSWLCWRCVCWRLLLWSSVSHQSLGKGLSLSPPPPNLFKPLWATLKPPQPEENFLLPVLFLRQFYCKVWFVLVICHCHLRLTTSHWNSQIENLEHLLLRRYYGVVWFYIYIFNGHLRLTTS